MINNRVNNHLFLIRFDISPTRFVKNLACLLVLMALPNQVGRFSLLPCSLDRWRWRDRERERHLQKSQLYPQNFQRVKHPIASNSIHKSNPGIPSTVQQEKALPGWVGNLAVLGTLEGESMQPLNLTQGAETSFNVPWCGDGW